MAGKYLWQTPQFKNGNRKERHSILESEDSFWYGFYMGQLGHSSQTTRTSRGSQRKNTIAWDGVHFVTLSSPWFPRIATILSEILFCSSLIWPKWWSVFLQSISVLQNCSENRMKQSCLTKLPTPHKMGENVQW